MTKDFFLSHSFVNREENRAVSTDSDTVLFDKYRECIDLFLNRVTIPFIIDSRLTVADGLGPVAAGRSDAIECRLLRISGGQRPASQ